jgi:hypothetical protein
MSSDAWDRSSLVMVKRPRRRVVDDRPTSRLPAIADGVRSGNAGSSRPSPTVMRPPPAPTRHALPSGPAAPCVLASLPRPAAARVDAHVALLDDRREDRLLALLERAVAEHAELRNVLDALVEQKEQVLQCMVTAGIIDGAMLHEQNDAGGGVEAWLRSLEPPAGRP